MVLVKVKQKKRKMAPTNKEEMKEIRGFGTTRCLSAKSSATWKDEHTLEKQLASGATGKFAERKTYSPTSHPP